MHVPQYCAWDPVGKCLLGEPLMENGEAMPCHAMPCHAMPCLLDCRERACAIVPSNSHLRARWCAARNTIVKRGDKRRDEGVALDGREVAKITTLSARPSAPARTGKDVPVVQRRSLAAPRRHRFAYFLPVLGAVRVHVAIGSE